MTTLHIVMASTGEYSGRTEYPVVWYDREADAQAHVRRASDRARELLALSEDDHGDGEHSRLLHWGKEHGMSPERITYWTQYDPFIREMACTGTRYWVQSVERGSVRGAP